MVQYVRGDGGDGSAVSLQLIAVGTRHCRLLACHSGVAGIDTNRRLDRSSHEPRFGIIRGTAYNPLNLHLTFAVNLNE